MERICGAGTRPWQRSLPPAGVNAGRAVPRHSTVRQRKNRANSRPDTPQQRPARGVLSRARGPGGSGKWRDAGRIVELRGALLRLSPTRLTASEDNLGSPAGKRTAEPHGGSERRPWSLLHELPLTGRAYRGAAPSHRTRAKNLGSVESRADTWRPLLHSAADRNRYAPANTNRE